MSDLILPPDPAPLVLSQRARDYATASKSPATLRAYSSAWEAFTTWCQVHQVQALPAAPATVASFAADLATTKKVATIERHLAAISEAHRLAGHESPTTTAEVRAVLGGIKRTHGSAQEGKAPLLVAHLRQISEILPDSLLGVRDRALLLVSFAGALRRSELVALDVADLDFRADGLVISLRRSKTDQEGHGRLVGVPYGSNPATCPVRAAKRWIEQSAVEHGAVFRAVNRHGRVGNQRLSTRAVAQVVQRAVASIGLDPAKYGGHSMRAGLATEAARVGVSEIAIMRQTGHRSVVTLRGYVRPATLFTNNAAAAVGL